MPLSTRRDEPDVVIETTQYGPGDRDQRPG